MTTTTTALIIVDMQLEFASMVPNPLPNVVKLSSFFQSKPSHSPKQLLRIFVQHGHTPAELSPPYPNQLVQKWGADQSLARGSSNWQFQPEVAALYDASSCPRIDKSSYDAFINTELEQVLKENGVGRVVICGVMTDCCCDATGRSAFNRGYETWLVGDARATDTEEIHQQALSSWARVYGEVLTTEEVLKRLG